MEATASELTPVRSQEEIVLARQQARGWAVKLGFSLVDQTKIVTATSELARNAVTHGGGGTMQIELVTKGPRRGLRLSFVDQGPGIPDLQLALKDGYTSGNGMGLGLSGSRRLMDEFQIESAVGVGTRVVVTKWK